MGLNTLLFLTLSLHAITAAKLKDITAATTVIESCESCAGTAVSGKTTPEAILRRQIDVTLTELDRAEKESAELAAKDDKRNHCNRDCAANFDKAKVMLNDAVTAQGQKDIWKLEVLLTDAVDHYEPCDEPMTLLWTVDWSR